VLASARLFGGEGKPYTAAFCSLCSGLLLSLKVTEDCRRRRGPDRESRVEVAIGEDQKRRKGEVRNPNPADDQSKGATRSKVDRKTTRWEMSSFATGLREVNC
jgi:hypothetical protein